MAHRRQRGPVPKEKGKEERKIPDSLREFLGSGDSEEQVPDRELLRLAKIRRAVTRKRRRDETERSE